MQIRCHVIGGYGSGSLDKLEYDPADPYLIPVVIPPPVKGDIDEGIQSPIQRVNQSGWLWTEWSCEGHSTEPAPRTYVTFVFRETHGGHFLRLLGLAMRRPNGTSIVCGAHVNWQTPEGWLRVTVSHAVESEEWRQEVLAVFGRMAELACREIPNEP